MSDSRRVARIVAREQVGQRAEAMLRLLDERDPTLRQRLQNVPLLELATWPDLQITYIDAADQSTDCTIAGAYIDTIDPPVIGIVQGSFSRREAFTVLHELGHHLQHTEVELIEGLPGQADRGRVLEEMTSDAFAAAILIPPSLAAEILGEGTPTASQVARLWNEGSASRAAVCVRAAQNLRSPGHVVLLDSEGEIVFSSTHADYPLRRGLDQSQTDIVRSARSSRARLLSGKTSWTYAKGSLGQEMYAQATWLGDYLLVVSVVDGAPWEKISLSAPTRTFAREWHQCTNCGYVMKTFGADICPTCNDPKCTDCGRCACPSRVAERTCSDCTMIKPAQFFTGTSTLCIDCA